MRGLLGVKSECGEVVEWYGIAVFFEMSFRIPCRWARSKVSYGGKVMGTDFTWGKQEAYKRVAGHLYVLIIHVFVQHRAGSPGKWCPVCTIAWLSVTYPVIYDDNSLSV